jgi:hypothetical protein
VKKKGAKKEDDLGYIFKYDPEEGEKLKSIRKEIR